MVAHCVHNGFATASVLWPGLRERLGVVDDVTVTHIPLETSIPAMALFAGAILLVWMPKRRSVGIGTY